MWVPTNSRPNAVLPICCLFVVLLSAGLANGAPNINGIKTDERLNSAYASLRFLYPKGMNGESQLRPCGKWDVCSRVDTYSRPWIERLCSCPSGKSCSSSLMADDGHTIVDKPRQYKVCESVDKLPTCRFFRDITWSFVTLANNVSKQIVHCKCPANSTPYLSGRDVEYTNGTVYRFHFSCSPHTAIRCKRKEPCRLFSVSKRYPVEEVTSTTLCQCPLKTYCPKRHTDPYVVEGRDSKVGLRTFSGYCWPTGR